MEDSHFVAPLILLAIAAIWLLPFFFILASGKTTKREKLAWVIAVIFVSWFAWIFYLLLAPIKKKEGHHRSGEADSLLRRENSRTKGPWNFILKAGVLGWGLGCAVLFAPLFAWVTGNPFWPVLGLAVILFPLGGVLWGYFMWLCQKPEGFNKFAAVAIIAIGAFMILDALLPLTQKEKTNPSGLLMGVSLVLLGIAVYPRKSAGSPE